MRATTTSASIPPHMLEHLDYGEIGTLAAGVAAAAVVLGLLMWLTDMPGDVPFNPAATKEERRRANGVRGGGGGGGVGWVHMSTVSRSGKGVARTRAAAEARCAQRASESLERTLNAEEAVCAMERQLFDNIECLRGQTRVVFSGDLAKRARAQLHQRIGTLFSTIYYDEQPLATGAGDGEGVGGDDDDDDDEDDE